ncbi:MAG TPA: KTSC domain-containing protein [Kofleriaceae bacterium]|nr:KTSC domain-containing protein [Kofleriaceae bacterium]
MPKMIAVSSTSVQRVGYATAERELHVQFKSSDTIYIYEGVPRAIFEQLLAAPSIGTFVNQQIKDAYAFHTQ